MRNFLLLLLIFASCTSRTERINKRLIVLYSYRDSLNTQYRMLQAVKDSLRYVSANTRAKYGKPDSLTEISFFKNEEKTQNILSETDKVGREIKDLELAK